MLLHIPSLFGWKMGLEPTTFGTTIRRSNRLNYIHRIGVQNKAKISISQNFKFIFSYNCQLLSLIGSKKMNIPVQFLNMRCV